MDLTAAAGVVQVRTQRFNFPLSYLPTHLHSLDISMFLWSGTRSVQITSLLRETLGVTLRN